MTDLDYVSRCEPGQKMADQPLLRSSQLGVKVHVELTHRIPILIQVRDYYRLPVSRTSSFSYHYLAN